MEVTPLITMADPEAATEIVVPERVIGDPGARVWEPTTYLPAALGVIIVPPIVRADMVG